MSSLHPPFQQMSFILRAGGAEKVKRREDAPGKTEKGSQTIDCLTKTAHKRLQPFKKRTSRKTLTGVNL
jgi:hypothetical protein